MPRSSSCGGEQVACDGFVVEAVAVEAVVANAGRRLTSRLPLTPSLGLPAAAATGFEQADAAGDGVELPDGKA